jgi:hypothetical protein
MHPRAKHRFKARKTMAISHPYADAITVLLACKALKA